VSEPFFDALLPTSTRPNATVAGDTESCALELLNALGAGARLHPANRAVASNTNPNR
jgi:hypothetical protein